MNKYDILEGKLTAINEYIDTMCLESNATMEYLKQYKEYIKLLSSKTNTEMYDSQGTRDTSPRKFLRLSFHHSNFDIM